MVATAVQNAINQKRLNQEEYDKAIHILENIDSIGNLSSKFSRSFGHFFFASLLVSKARQDQIDLKMQETITKGLMQKKMHDEAKEKKRLALIEEGHEEDLDQLLVDWEVQWEAEKAKMEGNSAEGDEADPGENDEGSEEAGEENPVKKEKDPSQVLREQIVARLEKEENEREIQEKAELESRSIRFSTTLFMDRIARTRKEEVYGRSGPDARQLTDQEKENLLREVGNLKPILKLQSWFRYTFLELAETHV